MTRTVERISTLIKKKRKFSSYIRKFRGIGCNAKSYMTYDLLINGENICAFPHILGSPSSYIWLCTRSHLNFPICEGNFVFFFISAAVFLEACYIRGACGRRCGAWRPSPTPASCPSVTSAPAPATATAPAPGTDWPEISTPAAGPMTPLRPTGENNCLHCLFVCYDQQVAWGKQIIHRILWSLDHWIHWMIMYTPDVWPLLSFAWLKCSLDK